MGRTVPILLTLCLIATAGVWAGNLNPSGAPAGTMVTLDQLSTSVGDSRTPITALPASISSPGSYYLQGNLTAAVDQSGITISADHVTIDLNGFSLIGGGGTIGDGIFTGSSRNVTVRNGVVRGWADEGIDLFQGQDSLVEDVRATFNGGIGVRTGDASVVRNCIATENVDYGIAVGRDSLVSGCVANSNGRTNPANMGGGIALRFNSVLENSTANDNQGTVTMGAPPIVVNGVGVFASNGCVIRNVLAEGNAGVGIFVADAGRVSDCVLRGNGSAGISAFVSAVITGCFAADNSSAGITATENSLISGNTCVGNLHGIVAGDSLITDNLCNDNTNDGIQGLGNSQIQGNHCGGNARGIAFSDGTLVIHNYCTLNTNSVSNQYVALDAGSIGLGSPVLIFGTAMNGTNVWSNVSNYVP